MIEADRARFGVLSCAAALLLFAPAVSAEPVAAPEAHTDSADEIVVYGRSIARIGIATSGSEGVVGYRDFEDRPLGRVGELVENVPGVIATQHSGTGKANQYSCAASTWITAPISPASSTACRSTCGPTRTGRAISTSTS